MEKHVFYAPVEIGQKIYVPYEDDDGEDGLIAVTVTEVASKGCFVSNHNPPQEDLGTYYPYCDLGRTWFTRPPKGGRQEQEMSL